MTCYNMFKYIKCHKYSEYILWNSTELVLSFHCRFYWTLFAPYCRLLLITGKIIWNKRIKKFSDKKNMCNIIEWNSLIWKRRNEIKKTVPVFVHIICPQCCFEVQLLHQLIMSPLGFVCFHYGRPWRSSTCCICGQIFGNYQKWPFT